VNKEQIVTILILIGLFGVLVDGPIASLLDYHTLPVKCFWLFIIPEFIGFTCAGIMVYYGRSRNRSDDRNCADILTVQNAMHSSEVAKTILKAIESIAVSKPKT
jgi:hypothetical protein